MLLVMVEVVWIGGAVVVVVGVVGGGGVAVAGLLVVTAFADAGGTAALGCVLQQFLWWEIAWMGGWQMGGMLDDCIVLRVNLLVRALYLSGKQLVAAI